MSAACSQIQKLRQVLQSKCLLTTNNAPQYVSNRQIEEVVKVPTLLSKTAEQQLTLGIQMYLMEGACLAETVQYVTTGAT
jgi:hypothetical protein